MVSRIYIPIILISWLIIFQSCDDEWIFDIPGCMDQSAINYDSNATSDNGSCDYYMIETVTINASAYFYDEWIYFSFSSGEVVTVSNPESSEHWDIAFSRNNIITNSGSSGSGKVCAIVDDTQTWTNDSFYSADQIPDGEWECQVDEEIEGDDETSEGCYCNSEIYCGGHGFISCDKNPALDQWGSFDGFDFIVSNYQFFVKGLDEDYVKLWLKGYSDTSGESGYITMAYQTIE